MKTRLLLIILLTSISLISCSDSRDDIIKKGYFDRCPDYTVEELINDFFEDAYWESFISPDDNRYHLDVSGVIYLQEYNIPVDALIQFQLNGGDRWEINAFTINSEPQEVEQYYYLIDSMCMSYSY